MKKYFLFICTFLLIYSSVIAQIESVKKKSDLQWINDSICYDNGNEFTGEVIDYMGSKFDKAKLLYDGHFIYGQRNGLIKQWYSNFKIESIENYKMGRKEGIQTYFYVNGNKKTEIQYSRGLKDGKSSDWYDNGQLKSSYQYSQGGLVDGTYTVYYENGQKKQESLYSGGTIINDKIFRNDSIIESREIKADYDPVTKENSKGFLINNKKDGLWTYWYDGVQKKKEGYFKDGVEVGKWTFWYEDGKVQYIGTCKNGKKEGQGVLNYKSQSVLNYIGEFKNDLRDGYGTLRYVNGDINYEGEWKNGLPDGQGKGYDQGRLVYDGEWKNGKKNGIGTYINYSDDILTFKGNFSDGSMIGQGTLTWTDNEGTSYCVTGEFKDGKIINGTSSYQKTDGSRYMQEIKEGKRGKNKKIN